MRKVEAASEFDAALESAKREAKSAFNDDRVLIEKYVTRPRHIEVQVFADAHGNAVHLFERDCSLQRRHQKVIEEAPAPGMSEAMRASIGAAAVKAAQAVNYVGAGTIEFIADASDGLKPDRIWFMEMNTRLQVEHPVTEAITGLDLVEWQLQVAAGRKLPKQQHELKIKGHAIEARLYAEDPRKNFLPSIGTLQRLRFGEGENIRIDTGVRQADAVTPFYDPMIAKVIAWDEDRKGAAAKLATALAHTQVAGVATNAGFLVRALRNTAFLADDIDTGFIDRHLAELTTAPPATTALPQAVEFLLIERARGDHSDPWNAQDGFRLSGEAKEHLTFTQGEDRFPVEIVHKRGATEIVIAGRPQSPASAENAMRLASGEIAVMHNGDTQIFAVYDPFDSEDSSGSASDRIIAPMPGKVVQLLVKAGDKVKRGAPLAILEAMKMENTLAAQADATVAEIAVGIGDQVGEGALILTFETEAGK
jgi:3-methylcrotonyl-CoA carboxylase alpha subunit